MLPTSEVQQFELFADVIVVLEPVSEQLAGWTGGTPYHVMSRAGRLLAFENLQVALIHVHQIGDEDRLAQQLAQRDDFVPADPVHPRAGGTRAQIHPRTLQLTAHSI